jgi:hypothetical protein
VPTPTPAPAAPPASYIGTVLDDDGYVMPGVIDPALPPDQQAAQLQQRLEQQGLSTAEATRLAQNAIFDTGPVLAAPSLESQSWTPEELQARIGAVQSQLEQELAAQEARDASLENPYAVETGGGANGNGVRAPVQLSRNANADAALNLASDPLGLAEPLMGLRADMSRLDALNAESRIEAMRETLRAAGVKDIPAGYEQAFVEGGNMVRDYGATANKLQAAYEDFSRDKRLTETWGADYKDKRIGNSKMTVQQFEQKVFEVQQAAVDRAYDDATIRIAKGQLKVEGNYMLTAGSYVDDFARKALRAFAVSEGLPDSVGSNLYAVNRRLTGPDGYGVPDSMLGKNLVYETTLAQKNGSTPQVQNWNSIRNVDVLIVRPSQLGGSYVIPKNTIGRIVRPGGG